MTHLFTLLGTLGLLCSAIFAGEGPPARPNIVVFLCDDLGLLDSTPYGATDVRTPNLQRLADGGITFDRAFVASPACAPSRAAMLCGIMPARNGAEANHACARPEIKGWPHYLRELGYDTVAFGKVAHLADVKRWGFTHFDQKFDLALVREHVSGRDTGRPLCLFVGTHDPHVPWDRNRDYDPAKVKLPWNFVDTPETREFRTDYYTEITRADADMGTLHDFIRQALGTNTLFMFSSDHGAQWPFGKWNLYDTSIRTPLLASWPGVIKPGTRTGAMVSWVDFTPTLIELAGGTPPPGLDGRSFAGVLLGRAAKHLDEIFTTHSGDGKMNAYPVRALRTERFKYIRNLCPQYAHTTFIDRARNEDGLKYWRTWVAAAQTNAGAAAIVKRYHERPAEELYDVVADPDEKRNLAASSERAQTLRQLRERVDAWMKGQGDQWKLLNESHPLGAPELPGIQQDAPRKAKGSR
ncbi:MAG: sulfatase [Limisphaerales bacterium]